MKVGDIIKVRKTIPHLHGQHGVIIRFQRMHSRTGPNPLKAVVHLFGDPSGKAHRYLATHNLKKHRVPKVGQQEPLSGDTIVKVTQKRKKNGRLKETYHRGL